MTVMIATPESVLTYDEAIRCPSAWTPDQWMNAISLMSGISYDQTSRCPSLDTGCGWMWDANPCRWRRLLSQMGRISLDTFLRAIGWYYLSRIAIAQSSIKVADDALSKDNEQQYPWTWDSCFLGGRFGQRVSTCLF